MLMSHKSMDQNILINNNKHFLFKLLSIITNCGNYNNSVPMNIYSHMEHIYIHDIMSHAPCSQCYFYSHIGLEQNIP